MAEKPCNCKAKKNTDILITKIEDINKSKAQGYAKKNNKLRTISYKLLKYFTYIILIGLVAISILPFLLFIVVSKKQIKIDLSRLIKWGRK